MIILTFLALLVSIKVILFLVQKPKAEQGFDVGKENQDGLMGDNTK